MTNKTLMALVLLTLFMGALSLGMAKGKAPEEVPNNTTHTCFTALGTAQIKPQPGAKVTIHDGVIRVEDASSIIEVPLSTCVSITTK